jgi:hypothetical protein
VRFERDEQARLQRLADRPYTPVTHLVPANTRSTHAAAVTVQRRPLSAYAEVVR